MHTRKLGALAAVAASALALGVAACGDDDDGGSSGGGGSGGGDETNIAIVSKGFQHQFWQAVKAGADKAATEFNVEVTFEGPDNETQVDKQIDMLSAALAKGPAAIGFAALDTQAAIPLLNQAR